MNKAESIAAMMLAALAMACVTLFFRGCTEAEIQSRRLSATTEQVRQRTLPAVIAACRTACAPGVVHKTDEHGRCECK